MKDGGYRCDTCIYKRVGDKDYPCGECEDGDMYKSVPSKGCENCKHSSKSQDGAPCFECIRQGGLANWEPMLVNTLMFGMQDFLNNLPDREDTEEGRKETPIRYFNALKELTSGYEINIPSIFKIFEDIPGDQMVIATDIHFTSLCEHHILPFHGKAYIGYIPAPRRVVGISKLARLFYAHSKRLQVQERIGHDVVRDIMQYLAPASGAICVIKAQHFCMTSRGVKAEGSFTVTSAFEGSFKEPVVRQEFFQLAGI